MERSKIIKSIQSLEKTENVVKYELIDTVSENRIQNAIQCYAPTCKREEIVAMVDTTLRKNGKKGMLITTECIYGSAFSDSPIELEGLKAIIAFDEIAVEDGDYTFSQFTKLAIKDGIAEEVTKRT